MIFWPDNIVNLFERFGVKKNFDFLSEDSDSYDFFMTEAILEVSSNKILPKEVYSSLSPKFSKLLSSFSQYRTKKNVGNGHFWPICPVQVGKYFKTREISDFSTSVM